MTSEIIRKLGQELEAGIATEGQVVYLLVGIRKLIEREGVGDEYSDLKFHCDWALHSSLEGTAAKAILRQFDAAHAFLRASVELADLPAHLRSEIDRISKMKSFKRELARFLAAYDLPPLTRHRSDGWTHFLRLYARVIEDIPLVVRVGVDKRKLGPRTTHSPPKHISRVTVHCELARETVRYPNAEELFFKVRWAVQDKNGESGEIFVINSFSLKA
jgi:hypothetical protein